MTFNVLLKIRGKYCFAYFRRTKMVWNNNNISFLSRIKGLEMQIKWSLYEERKGGKAKKN